jgi:predicted Fe-Mo cluster-binding NifX family protein
LKIAVTASGPELDSQVGQRFGMSPYLIVIDPETLIFEAIENPVADGQTGAGIQAVIFAITLKIDAVLTGYCSPTAEKYLAENKIAVYCGLSGTVSQAIKHYRQIVASGTPGDRAPLQNRDVAADEKPFITGFKKTLKQMISILPFFFGTILLIGLFSSFVSKEMLLAVFSQNEFLDMLLGNLIGSILTTNPLNSYIIAQELLEKGISLYAVTALITAWVTVGIIQLPFEIATLGRKFALVRNALFFIISMVISVLTVAVYTITKIS